MPTTAAANQEALPQRLNERINAKFEAIADIATVAKNSMGGQQDSIALSQVELLAKRYFERMATVDPEGHMGVVDDARLLQAMDKWSSDCLRDIASMGKYLPPPERDKILAITQRFPEAHPPLVRPLEPSRERSRTR